VWEMNGEAKKHRSPSHNKLTKCLMLNLNQGFGQEICPIEVASNLSDSDVSGSKLVFKMMPL
jgi:hypothetical protein